LNSVSTRLTFRAIAAFEAVKGVAVLAAVIGILDLMHRDVRQLAMELIGLFGLSPGARYPSMLLHYADLLPGAHVRSLLVFASIYISVRLLEAYGLWHQLAWGKWMGAISIGLYVPFEVRHLIHRPSMLGAAVFVVNLSLVVFLVGQLWVGHKNHATHQSVKTP
jgi:uncharacterized membrane protein (DUF2068 family)